MPFPNGGYIGKSYVLTAIAVVLVIIAGIAWIAFL